MSWLCCQRTRRWTSATMLESTKDSRRGDSYTSHSVSVVTCLQISLRLNVWCVTARSTRAKQWTMDLKMGVVTLGMLDSRVTEHLIRNIERLDSWFKTRDEILQTARTQQNTNSLPAPMQLGATPKGKNKGRRKGRPKQRHCHQAEMRQQSKAKAKANSLATEKGMLLTVRRKGM